MITFETKEDFENAVIDIIKTRLRVSTGYDCGERTLDLSICRWTHDDVPDDDQFARTDLPTPSIRY